MKRKEKFIRQMEERTRKTQDRLADCEAVRARVEAGGRGMQSKIARERGVRRQTIHEMVERAKAIKEIEGEDK